MAVPRKRRRRPGVKWIRWEDEFDITPGEDWHELKEDAIRLMEERLAGTFGLDRARYSIAWGYRERPADIDESPEYWRDLKWWSTPFQTAEGAVTDADIFIENVQSGEYYKRYTNIDIVRVGIIVLTPRPTQD
jgi:hypothetical protein